VNLVVALVCKLWQLLLKQYSPVPKLLPCSSQGRREKGESLYLCHGASSVFSLDFLANIISYNDNEMGSPFSCEPGLH
jgi:hypothetical protein